MLDDRLIEVINKKSSDLLVIGPPGSGKTHTLLELAGYLINNKRISPEKLLIFCFNRRWSKLIREKTASLIGRSILEIPVETFHSFCIRFINTAKIFLSKKDLLSKAPSESMDNYNPFEDLEILNSVQQWELLRNIIKTLDKKKYPYTFRYINSNTFIENSYIQEVFDFILRAQENLFKPEELLDKFSPFVSPVLSELGGIYSRYIKELKKSHLYNYGMLLEETVSLLKNHKEIRDYFRQSYEYILVDELQEVNKAQFEIINYLSNTNCIFFGNDDQSIYTFRGSTRDIFKLIYLELKPENVIFLKKNYRNTPVINEACAKFISLIKSRIPKEIAVSNNNSQGELYIKEFNTLLEEANFICSKVKFLYFNKGVKLEEIAVIIKGLGYETHIIENALLQSGIPFARRGTRSLLDNKLIKYLLNFMRFLVTVKEIENSFSDIDDSNNTEKNNNDSKYNNLVIKLDNLIENIMLSDIINLEPLFFKKVRSYCLNNSNNGSGGLWDYFKSKYTREKRNKNIKGEYSKIANFVSSVYRLIKIMGKKDVFDFLRTLIRDRKAGIMNYLMDEKNNKIIDINQWNNLSDFLNNVKNFSIKNTPCDVASYINFIDDIIKGKFTEEIEESTKDIIQPGLVNIMSFHQCKGMEFKAVFIPFINKNYLPSKFVFTQAFDTRIFNYPDDVKKPEVEELKRDHLYGEIRLFYNGITRAKEYLYITSSSRKKSIFFEEMKSIYRDLSSKYKKTSELRRDEDVEAAESKKEKISKDKKVPQAELLLDIDLGNTWLIRKRAVAAIARMHHNLKVNYTNYLNNIIVLKYFYHPDQWWNFITPTKNIKNPFELLPSSFSYSSLDTFRDCPFKYKIMYYFNLKEEDSISLIIGKIYHEIIRIFFKSKADYSWERLEKIVNQVFERYNFEFKFLKRELKERALIEFRNFFENLMPLRPDKSVVEKEFLFNLGSENISVRIDQINFIGEEDIEIVDYKSGSSSYSDRELKEELQLKVYRMALEASKDLKDFKFMNVKMKYICLGNLKKPVYVVPEECYRYSEILDMLNKSILKIKDEKFNPEPKSYNSCLNCGFKVLCPKYYG